MKTRTRLLIATVGIGMLAGCNWIDRARPPQIQAPTDLPPTAEIVFPTRTGFTPSTSLQVRGTASDDNGVASVSVNGVLASSTDQYATWTIDVPLDYGSNTLSVDVTDTAGNSEIDADSLVVERRTEIRRPFGYELDTASNTLYYVDIDLFKIMTMNLATGSVEEFIDLQQFKPLTTTDRPPLDIALDFSSDRVFLTVRTIDVAVPGESSIGIWVYDMVAETWSAFSDSSVDSAAIMLNPSDVILDAANSRLLVLDYFLEAVVAVDLATGLQTLFSSNSVPNNVAPGFGEPIDAVLDSAGNRLLVMDRFSDTLFSVSLTDGSRTLISGNGTGSGNPLSRPLALEFDVVNNRVLTYDSGGVRGVIAIDLATGARTEFSRSFDDPNGLWLIDVRALAISGNELIVLDNVYDHALAFDLTTAARRLVSNNGFPRGSNDPALYSVEMIGDAFFGHTFNAIGRIDADNNVDILAGDVTGGANAIDVNRATFNATATTAYIVGDVFVNNLREYRAQSVDLATGAVTTISGNAIPDAINPILSARSLVMSDDGNTLYLLEDNRITLIDIATGARTIMADDGSLPYGIPEEMALDSANDRLLIADRNYNRLIAVDTTTGARSIFANAPVSGENQVERAETITVADNGAIFIRDLLDRLVHIDPQSGERTIVVDISALGIDYPPYWEQLTTGGDVVYAKTYEGIVEVDPQSGELLLIHATPASAPGNAT